MALVDEQCARIVAGTPPVTNDEKAKLALEIPNWTLQEKSMFREWVLKDFKEAITFVNKIAELAEQENHHPDICISYNKVHIELSTHKIGGLSMNDFILAAKIDQL
jgi:4a-hydroxytetrahydrobiopterin dehydratase